VNFAIILESLKFYKLKHERSVQVWFVLLYALNMLVYVVPFADTDFSAYYLALDNLFQGTVIKPIYLTLTPGNWFVLGMIVLLALIGAFFSLLYAALYVGEHEATGPRQALAGCLAALPRLLLLGLLLIVPAILSACLLFVPLIIFAIMMYFVPLGLVLDKRPLAETMHKSFNDTRKQRLFIFAQIFLLSAIISLPRSIILSIVPASQLSYAIAATFFTVLQALMQGRMMGVLYLVLVKKVQFVIPSRPNG
jgi:hypothetical protein